jgi:DNA-binding CsgD family transcriptional regulator
MRLAEREIELRIITTMFAAGHAGGGGVAIVSGATATGKTALLNAAAQAAQASGALYLGTAASRVEGSVPLGLIRDLLRGLSPADARPEVISWLLENDLAAATLRNGEQLSMQILQNAGDLLLDLAVEQPVVIGVDDVHYADTPSMMCLAYVARRLRAARMAVVLTACSGPHGVRPLVHTEIMGLPYYRHIRLGPLSVHGVAEMLRAHLEWPAARRLADDCYQRSGGNPLLVRALIEDFRTASQPESTEMVPGDAFDQAVLNCLYRSGSPVIDTAHALAVVGSPVAPTVLSEMLGLWPEAINQASLALTRAGLLVDGWFRHPALPAAILHDVLPSQRAALHAQAARALHDYGAPAPVLAAHLIAAGRVPDPWVVPTLHSAGEQALAHGEIGTAVACLRAALDASDDSRDKMVLKFLLCCAEWLVDPANAQRHLPELVEAVRTGTLEARYAVPLVSYLLWHGRPDDAAVLVDTAERQSCVDTIADRAIAESAIGPQRARQWLTYAYPGVRDADGQRAEHPPGGCLGITPLIAAPASTAVSGMITDAEHVLQASRLGVTTAAPTWTALATLIYADELDKAGAWCEALVMEAGRQAAPLYWALFLALESIASQRRGRMAEAADCARSALTIISPKAWGVVVGLPLAGILLATTALGKRDEATAYYAVPVPAAMFQTPFGLHYLQARGHFHLASGRFQAALGDFNACGSLMARWGLDVPTLIPWRTDAAQALLKMGDKARARELARQQLELLGPGPSRSRGMSLRILAAATELRKRPPLLKESIEVLGISTDYHELALAVGDLRHAHWALGDHDKAIAIESTTRQLTEQLSCSPLPSGLFPDITGEAQEGDPAACNVRAITQLSNAELRVAALAAKGQSNRQISNALFITVSTVEQHLTRVYRKLSVNSRAELPAELKHLMISV